MRTVLRWLSAALAVGVIVVLSSAFSPTQALAANLPGQATSGPTEAWCSMSYYGQCMTGYGNSYYGNPYYGNSYYGNPYYGNSYYGNPYAGYGNSYMYGSPYYGNSYMYGSPYSNYGYSYMYRNPYSDRDNFYTRRSPYSNYGNFYMYRNFNMYGSSYGYR